MRTKLLRTTAALIVAGAVAGSAEAPVAVGSEAASATPTKESRVSPDGKRSLRRGQLYARTFCDASSGYCTASAWGGTGEYVSWDWYGADEYSGDGGDTSFATLYCPAGYAWGVSAVVTDSSGATAAGDVLVFCPS